MHIYFEVPRYFPLKAYCYDTLNLVHSPGSSVGKESTCNTGDPSSIPGSGRSAGEEIGYPLQYSWGSLTAQLVKNPPAMWETPIRSLGWGRSPGEGKGYPLQYSGLENFMDCIACGITKIWTQLSNFHFPFGDLTYLPMEEAVLWEFYFGVICKPIEITTKKTKLHLAPAFTRIRILGAFYPLCF